MALKYWIDEIHSEIIKAHLAINLNHLLYLSFRKKLLKIIHVW